MFSKKDKNKGKWTSIDDTVRINKTKKTIESSIDISLKQLLFKFKNAKITPNPISIEDGVIQLKKGWVINVK